MSVLPNQTSLNYHNHHYANRPNTIINKKQKKELTNDKPPVNFFDQNDED